MGFQYKQVMATSNINKFLYLLLREWKIIPPKSEWAFDAMEYDRLHFVMVVV
jgi:hypothetical protein